MNVRSLLLATTLLTVMSETSAWAQDQPDSATAASMDACAVLENEPATILSGEEVSDAEFTQLRRAAFNRAQLEEACYRKQIEQEKAAARDAKERERLAKIEPGVRKSTRILGGERVRGVPFQVEIGYNPGLAAGTLINSGLTRERRDDTRNALAGRAAWDWKHICGGILIEPNLVLTAAHCATEKQFNFASGIVARLGAEDLANPKSLLVKIDRVVRHANYGEGKPGGIYADDIALMRLVPYTPSARVRAITPNRNPGQDFKTRFRQVTGWGKSGTSGARNEQFLQQINVNLLTTDECRVVRKKNGEENVTVKAHDRVLCASSMGVKSCEGDSGGPLFGGKHSFLLYGIVSWNRGGCRKESSINPGVYTRVSRYTDWIARAKSAFTRGVAFQYLP